MSLSKTRFCVYCHKTEETVPIRTCTGCKIITYCSKSCQREDYFEHEDVCKDIKYFDAVAKNGPKNLYRRSRAARELQMTYCCSGYDPDVDVEQTESIKQFARVLWAQSVSGIALRHNHYKAMEIAYDSTKSYLEFQPKGEEFDCSINSESICQLVELGRIGEALKMFKETFAEAEAFNNVKPKFLVAGMALGFVVWDMIKVVEKSYLAFVRVMDEAAPGSLANKITRAEPVMNQIQRFVFAEAYDTWKSGNVESNIQKAMMTLDNEDAEIIMKIVRPCPFFLPHDPAKYGSRIIRRLPWAMNYLKKFLDYRGRVVKPCF